MRILLIGQSGQVAHELERSLACLGEVISRSRGSEPALDLLVPEEVQNQIKSLRPDLVINAAAYTQVDRAESESSSAFAINAESVGEMALACHSLGIPLVHYSTDYVFDGKGTRPYRENDPTGPDGVYAASKCLGEERIRESGATHLILRTAWVYGLRGQNFLKTMLRLMAERENLGIVDDQAGAPTWSRMIAEATALMLSQCLTEKGFEIGAQSGTYHLTSAGSTTWYGFADAIRERGCALGYLSETAATLKPITTQDYPTPAKRPAYSVLDNSKLVETFGIQLPDWRKGLELCLRDSAP